MQPPATPAPLATPFAAKTPGAGHVVAADAINESIANGWFVKWLVNVEPVVVSVQSAGWGGDVRLTSCCGRQLSATPLAFTCLTGVFGNPLTPSQPP